MTDEDFKIFLEDFVDFLNSLEASATKLKQQISKLVGVSEPSIPEETFNFLKWMDERSLRLGDYQVAYKRYNVHERWLHAYNILKANNSVIANPFRLEGYQYRYWIYPEKYSDRIFRKKLSVAQA